MRGEKRGLFIYIYAQSGDRGNTDEYGLESDSN